MINGNEWYIYIVRCGDNSLYTGIAKNLNRRIREHQEQSAKCAKYLRGRTPITLVYQEPTESRSTASKRELEIKKLSKAKKEALIKHNSSSSLDSNHTKSTPLKQKESALGDCLHR